MAKPPAKKRFAPPRAEFLSAAFMSFWMNNIGVELALVKPFLETRLGFEDVDPQQLFLALLFLHLCFFFGPAYAARSRGALNNPAVYFLFYLLGELDGTAALSGALSAVGGTILGTFAYAQTLKAVPLTGFKGIVPAVAAGGAKKGVASEALVAFLNFLIAGAAPGAVGKELAPYAGAFFYVTTVVVERCKYSCGFMNPAVVLATHVVGGDAFASVQSGKKAAAHVATYAAGAALGALAAAAAKAVAGGTGTGTGKVPGSKPAGGGKGGKKAVGAAKERDAEPAKTRVSARVSARKREPKKKAA